MTTEQGRYRVKVRSPHTVTDYVVMADSRDDAWLHVCAHLDDLTPDCTHDLPEMVFWASPEEARDAVSERP